MASNVLTDNEPSPGAAAENLPLVVDLDGTLVNSDLLYESFFSALRTGFGPVFSAMASIRSGKAALKDSLARLSDIDYATLPYNAAVLDLIGKARAEGRKVYLATASDTCHATKIASHLNLFDGVFASDGTINLSSGRKADALVAAFGEGGFDYVGNDKPDLAVWKQARTAYTVRISPAISARLKARGDVTETVERRSRDWRIWLKALRVHQYAKNGLVFVPLLTAQRISLDAILPATLAFIAFCLCASSVYLVNDLTDLKSDRQHPSKHKRPLASGRVGIASALVMAVALILGAIMLGVLVGPMFLAVLLGYFALTTAYSFYLKRRMLVDVVTLALLYTARIFGGAAAIGVLVSHWLLGFSLFIFTSLALMKRYVELAGRQDRALADPTDRNYRISDLSIVAALAAATGVNAVMVLSLYVASPEIRANYTRPDLLWLMCPIMLYWIGRALMMAHRRTMNDDPIVFALTDRNSRLALICIIGVVAMAF